MPYFYFFIVFSIFLYFTFKKDKNWIAFFIIQGIFLDIFSIQIGANISILKIAGFIAFPYLIITKEYKFFWDLKLFKLIASTIIFMTISYIFYNFITPWNSDFVNINLKTSLFKSTKNLLTHFSEFGCIVFLANYIYREPIKIKKYYLLIPLLAIIGIYLEKIFSFDFFHHFTNGTELLLPTRLRGFAFEPRAASYHMAIIIAILLNLNLTLIKKTFFILVTLGAFFLANSMTGFITLILSILIIIGLSLFLGSKKIKPIFISLFFISLISGIFINTKKADPIITHIKSRLYVFNAEKLIDKFEFADAAAVNFFFKNPKNLFFGIGTGLAPIATSKYLPESKKSIIENGLTYLPFMGIMLILTNGGLFLLVIYLVIIWIGLREIYKLDIEKENRDFLLTMTCVFIGTYFLQVRYFHILGYAIMLYAEAHNRKFGYRKNDYQNNKVDSLTDKILSNSKHLFSEKLIRLIGNFITSIFIANLLGPVNFGQYAFVLSFVYIFLPIIDFGISEFVIKDLTNSETPENIIAKSLKVRLITSVLMIATSILIYVVIFNNDLKLLPYIAIFSLSFIFRSIDIVYHLFQSQLKNQIITTINNIIFVILLIAKIVAVYLGQGILTFIVISAFENILIGIFYYFALKKNKFFFNFADTSYDLNRYIKSGVPILIATLVGTLYLRIDQIFIELFLSSTDLGNYALAAKFINVTDFIPIAVATIGYPILVKNNSDDNIKSYFSIGFFTAILTLVGAYFILPLFLTLFIKSSFSNSIDILKKLSFIVLPMFFNIISIRVLILNKQLKLVLKQNLMILVFNIILNFSLISKYKVDGVIFATLMSYFFTYIFMGFSSYPFRKLLKSYFCPSLQILSELKKNIRISS